EWDRACGGSSDDRAYQIQQTRDGGYIVGGSSASGISGNKTSPGFGSANFWAVKLDANGNKVWEQSFEADGDDAITSIQQTSDGSYLLYGYSASDASGDKTAPNYGGYDYWVIK